MLKERNKTKLEERFIEGELTKELFEKYSKKYEAEKKELEQKLSNQTINSSNLEKIIEKGLEIAENISQFWASGDFNERQKLQSLVFPEGIIYSKKKDRVRTPRVNCFFAEIPYAVSLLSENKNSRSKKTGRNSRWVEPTCVRSNSFLKGIKLISDQINLKSMPAKKLIVKK